MSTLSVRQVRFRYLTLYALRWLPGGLLIPVMILLMQERGLSLSQIGLVATAQGLVVLALELPTGGFADALGRKPVLVVAWLICLVSLVLFAVADSFWLFALVWALQGIYRALDSGPLESWYVDATLAADPDAEYEHGLGHAGMVIGLAIGAGALLSGGLVALGPVGPISALTLPVLVAIVLQAISVVALLVMLVENRPAKGVSALRASVVEAPRMIGQAVGLLRRSRVLLALVAVELFWGFGMVTFESLLPVRLAEVVGGADRAAALLGPAGSAAWLANAAGAALTPFLLRRLGAAPAAALMRILQGVTVVGMGLLAGPVGVLVAYLACYTVHGASNPLHMGLLHRQVDGPYRTSVLSMNSMMAQPAGALGAVGLTALADRTSVSVAMLVGAVVLALGAPLYLPAWRASRSAKEDAPATAEAVRSGEASPAAATGPDGSLAGPAPVAAPTADPARAAGAATRSA
ncbi:MULTISPECIES: MFS transporter [Micromonospora]|uniref:MFS transporter n=1 Tax=Micromonospora solifontis TaxID=2487138 RepID=A0ABX9WG04_9ACTN|nr:MULTISPECIES: MFS transporter [Micromonospora]NES13458.1 MFS transporter [Micromonospora sp. PPF5-17B]NES37001.1 MFS transporter [Micromonospora solifontis]NES55526.1 MFS transporter [Micromonospora sp. PPF5-6]RNL98791.1 MFS transporter [Micromonospora solifontis]